MQILIVGGYGFIGSHLAERFFKEGHEIFIIDDLSRGKKEYVTIAHTFYEMNVNDRRCEEIFRVHNIDAAIYCAEEKNEASYEGANSYESAFGGLLHLLELVSKYQTRKFIFLGAGPDCESAGIALGEEAPLCVKDKCSFYHAMAEESCVNWKKIHDINLTVVRLATVYGARQREEQGMISGLIGQILRKEAPIVCPNIKFGVDFIYVEDVADAIFRLVSRDYAYDVLNISSGEACDMEQLMKILGEIMPYDKVEYKNDTIQNLCCLPIDPARCENELGWRMKYSLREGLKKTVAWYETQMTRESMTMREKQGSGSFFRRSKPYGENLLFFGMMAALMLSNPYKSVVNTDIGLDYNFVYIAVMGLLYGKSQSIPAAILSSALLMYSFIARGADFVAIIYQAQHTVHFAAYLFLGVLTGYVTDNKDRSYKDMEVAMQKTKERYSFLRQMYLKNNEIKERLYKQIVNSDDSIGRTYQIIRKLDSVEVESIFTAALEVVADMLGTQNVALYTFGRSKYYLRLKTKSGYKTQQIPSSLRVEAFVYLQDMLKDRQVFVNKLLVPGLPDMAVPIVQQDEVIAVLQVYSLRFEELTLHRQNLLRITARLIADSLGKAYVYELGMRDKRYVAGTNILVPDEFMKIYREIERRKKKSEDVTTFVLLRVKEPWEDYMALHKALLTVTREEDFIGLTEDGGVYLLLVNLSGDAIEKVRQRIQEAGVLTDLAEGVENG